MFIDFKMVIANPEINHFYCLLPFPLFCNRKRLVRKASNTARELNGRHALVRKAKDVSAREPCKGRLARTPFLSSERHADNLPVEEKGVAIVEHIHSTSFIRGDTALFLSCLGLLS